MLDRVHTMMFARCFRIQTVAQIILKRMASHVPGKLDFTFVAGVRSRLKQAFLQVIEKLNRMLYV